MCVEEVERSIRAGAELILPVATLAPYGMQTPLEAEAVCVGALSDALSRQSGALCASTFEYGYATPFRAFGGCSGVKESALETMIFQIVSDYVIQGIRRVWVLDGSWFSGDALERGLKRVSRSHNGVTVQTVAWQRVPEVRRLSAELSKGNAPVRTEYALLCMYSYITKGRVPVSKSKKGVNAEVFRAWSKRGRDPDKFRKIAPNAVSAAWEEAITEENGQRIFATALRGIGEWMECAVRAGKNK